MQPIAFLVCSKHTIKSQHLYKPSAPILNKGRFTIRRSSVSMLVIGSGMAAIIIVMASGMQWSVRRSPTAPTQPLPVQLILTTSATSAPGNGC
jgi:hypothetical protein